ncbi:MAG: toll/interleukin-1 receptor domain-containing protein [Atopobiaceae bacterium]|nr:toll/interleukin-1 receptor domain-containing protein [Atopobiaceae bacterium]
MLFILFGATTDVGKNCRAWFVKHDVPLIQKKCYIPDDFPLTTFYDKRNECSLEEVEACDYTYKNNGMVVGFDKLEILDAVRGRCDRLLTGAAYDVSFVESIKRGFGEYVTTICIYIEQPVLRQITSRQPGISDAEVDLRTNMGKQIKALLRDNRRLFDEILLYSGEGTAFDMDSIEIQLEWMVYKARALQRQLNDVHYVEVPYTGSKPYLFASYCHDDRSKVDMVLNYLQSKGCRVWYDDDLVNRAGKDWRDIVFEKLDASTQCILFWSANAAGSEEVERELKSMIRWGKPFFTIRIDDAGFKKSLESFFTDNQTLSLSDLRFEKGLINSIDRAVRAFDEGEEEESGF